MADADITLAETVKLHVIDRESDRAIVDCKLLAAPDILARINHELMQAAVGIARVIDVVEGLCLAAESDHEHVVVILEVARSKEAGALGGTYSTLMESRFGEHGFQSSQATAVVVGIVVVMPGVIYEAMFALANAAVAENGRRNLFNHAGGVPMVPPIESQN
jgi:hypothetical protein